MVSFILKHTRVLHDNLSSPISLLTQLLALLSPFDKWECSLHAKVFMSLKFLFLKAVFQKPFLCSAFHSSFLSSSKFPGVYFFWSPSHILISHHASEIIREVFLSEVIQPTEPSHHFSSGNQVVCLRYVASST